MSALRSHLMKYLVVAVAALAVFASAKPALAQSQPVPPGVLEGVVVVRTASGYAPVAGAEVRVFAGRSHEPVARGVSGREGGFRFAELRPGAYRVVASMDEVGVGQAGARLTARAGARVRVVLVPQRPRPPAAGVVEGRVFGMQGTPPAPGPVEGATVVIRNAAGVVGETTTNERGAFRFENVAAGHYVLIAVKRGVGSAEMRIEVPRNRGVRVEVRLHPEPPPLPPAGVLEGMVVTPPTGTGHGTPVPEATVRVFRAPITTGQLPVREGLTNAEGRFRFDGLDPGEFIVVAHKRDVGEGRAGARLTREAGARVVVVLSNR